jgi:hypothetical protein
LLRAASSLGTTVRRYNKGAPSMLATAIAGALLLLGLSMGVRSWPLCRPSRSAVPDAEEALAGPCVANIPSTDASTAEVPPTAVPPTATPPVKKAKISTLHPTQLAVGVQRVKEKAARIGSKTEKKQMKYFKEHPVPVIIGPEGGYYLVDHHHLCRAAQLLNIDTVFITVIQDGDWSHLAHEAFWKRMHESNYVWLHDAAGVPLTLDEFTKLLPKDVSGLTDDPYRSLAAIVREAGGFNKDWMPFAEFHWANFLRVHAPLAAAPEISDADIAAAMQYSRVPEAAHLPGFIN